MLPRAFGVGTFPLNTIIVLPPAVGIPDPGMPIIFALNNEKKPCFLFRVDGQTNFMDMKNETMFSLKADEEYTREFVFPFGDKVPAADMLENLSAVVLSLKKDASGKTIVDNSAHCAYGSAAGYVYNE